MKNDAIIKLARTRMSEATTADKDNREAALNDLKVTAGEQWTDEDLSTRSGRPCLTLNRLPRFVRQVTGDIRKLNPAVKVLAADEGADDDTAEIFEGLIRQIEYSAGASSIYEGAAESAAQCGIGNFRMLTDWEGDDSFNQEISIERIHNPFAVYWDPEAREPTRSDANFCFVTDRMSADDFKKEYPGKTAQDAEHDGNTDGLEYWSEAGDVIVAEYYWKEPKRIKLGLMADGSTVENPTNAHNAVRSRTVETHKVMWAKISGTDVLEGPEEIPCEYIPVVAVVGEEIHVGDKVVRTSVIRFAKDPQQLYNYYASADAEQVALQPKAPYMVSTKQINGLEDIWKTANSENHAFLPYNPDDKAPPPQRVQPPMSSSAMMNGMARAEDDMKATTGIYDAALGGRSNEQSGVAIRQRQLESDISTSIYTDNLAKSIEQAGRIMVSMIPRVYDTDRTLRIVSDNDAQKMVQVNGKKLIFDDNMTLQSRDVNALGGGKYDVRVSVGPNYTTRRQETAESMMQFVQAFPTAGQVAGDLIAKAMDWPDADKLAKRLEKTLPPGMIDIEELTPEQQQQAQQAQQAAQQQGQQEQQMQMAMVEAEIRSKTAKATEDEADAAKAQADAQKTQVETAILSGQVNDAIAQMVQEQVALALQSVFQQG